MSVKGLKYSSSTPDLDIYSLDPSPPYLSLHKTRVANQHQNILLNQDNLGKVLNEIIFPYFI